MIIRASHSVEPASCYRPLINCYAIWRHTRPGLPRIRIPQWSVTANVGATGPPTRVSLSLLLSPFLSLSLSGSRSHPRLHRVYHYTAAQRLQHGGSSAKFPANPTNLSQPNIGRWWILISTRRTSHLHTSTRTSHPAIRPFCLFPPRFSPRFER